MGRGVATTRPFQEGDFIAEYTGDLVTNLHEIYGRRWIYSTAWVKDHGDEPIPCYEFEFYWKGKKNWSVSNSWVYNISKN